MQIIVVLCWHAAAGNLSSLLALDDTARASLDSLVVLCEVEAFFGKFIEAIRR